MSSYDPPPPPRVTSSRIVYENRWLRLREDRLERADGSPGVYAVVEKSPAALVIAVEGDEVWMVEQFRHPLGGRYWELPQGALDDGGEAGPEEIARRELREETGLRAGSLERIGSLVFAPGISGQPFDVWLAADLEAGVDAPEPEEHGLRAERRPIAEVDRMIRDGEIVDSATVAAWHLYRSG
jgi:8-oxo-dGTP pyrophosphatase MutT (NUDIX family)